jgi:lipopolysaccharide biosynthesis regulator YciM
VLDSLVALSVRSQLTSGADFGCSACGYDADDDVWEQTVCIFYEVVRSIY